MVNTPVGAKARLTQDNAKLQQQLQVSRAQTIYLLRYVVELQEKHGEDFPFPELPPIFDEGLWRAVL